MEDLFVLLLYGTAAIFVYFIAVNLKRRYGKKPKIKTDDEATGNYFKQGWRSKGNRKIKR